MLIRIVKMTFSPDKTADFQARFHNIKHKIIEFKGCQYLELYQDKNNECVFFTYSHWQSEEDLNAYRRSDFFKEVWAKTKTMFTHKPEAWSVDKIVSLKKTK
ncbi:MAG: antibiotic biosynthesis monooxygenase [Flavobacteriaceae bacterium]|nr:MAG: antibiotic biosynthesis monooxygenase [Flavobacteriaceae bacterium]